MTEEIKEILDNLEYVSNIYKVHIEDGYKVGEEIPSSMTKELRLNSYSAKILLDCITSLQQENEDLKTIIKQYVDIVLHDRKVIDDLRKEIERLNNIINELEKYINDNYFYDDVGMKIFDVSLLEDKLKELKESDKNE